MSSYLVTGGCGFIGSHLAEHLIAQGNRVRILDDLSTGKRENAPAGAEVMIGNATDGETVDKAFKGVDGCFHLAAIASVQKSVTDWVGTHRTNASATVQVFDSARKAGKVPVVYTSSAAVYGDCPNLPIIEQTPPAPLTAYGSDKLSCDINADIAWRVHGVRSMGLRPFNVYGPRQDPSSPYSGVISIFFDRIRDGQPVTIYGDGSQTRDFIYVGDVVQAFANAMAKLRDAEGHDVVNLCTGRSTTILQLAETLETVFNRRVERNFASPRNGDIRLSVGNPAKLASRLGITSTTLLHEGLSAMQRYATGA